MKRNLTAYTKNSFFSYADRQALAEIGVHLKHLQLIEATKIAYWWLVNESWRFSPIFFYEQYVSRSFDSQYGTDTLARVDLTTLDIDSPNKDYGVYYQASPVYSTRKVLHSLKIAYEEFTFVDFGSGKGRTLLLAAELPFQRVIGVEFSRELHACALSNIAVFAHKKAKLVESVYCDATLFEIPLDNLVLYFFNPFDEEVLSQVLANVNISLEKHPRRVFAVYHYLPDKGLFENLDRFRLIKQWHRYYVYEWNTGSKL